MSNVSKIIGGTLWALLSLTLLPASSLADTILLKDGQRVEAENVIERDKNIFFTLYGLKMRVSTEAVLRIVRTHEAASTTPAILKGETTKECAPSDRVLPSEKAIRIDPLPVENPSGELPGKNQPEIRWSGFRDLRWAIDRSTFGPLKEVKSPDRQKEIKEYVREYEDLKVGRARLESIVYSFWRNQLYALSIRARGQSDCRALRFEVFNRFGVGLKGDQSRELYSWADPYSDRILIYDEAQQSSLFWMRSKDLDHRYQLSRLKATSDGINSAMQRP